MSAAPYFYNRSDILVADNTLSECGVRVEAGIAGVRVRGNRIKLTGDNQPPAIRGLTNAALMQITGNELDADTHIRLATHDVRPRDYDSLHTIEHNTFVGGRSLVIDNASLVKPAEMPATQSGITPSLAGPHVAGDTWITTVVFPEAFLGTPQVTATAAGNAALVGVDQVRATGFRASFRVIADTSYNLAANWQAVGPTVS